MFKKTSELKAEIKKLEKHQETLRSQLDELRSDNNNLSAKIKEHESQIKLRGSLIKEKDEKISELNKIAEKVRDQNEADILLETLKLVGIIDSKEDKTEIKGNISTLHREKESILGSLANNQARNQITGLGSVFGSRLGL